MTSGTVRSKRKMLGEKVSVKFSNKLFQMEKEKNILMMVNYYLKENI